jgi:cell wall-associated NlpC family hydrolase
MRSGIKAGIALLFWGVAVCGLLAQQGPRQTSLSTTLGDSRGGSHGRKPERTLSADDRLAVIAAALDAKPRRSAERDCSHLVHSIYERAGLPYAYADSSDLYAGVEGFQRVTRPQPGDLVVWRGHVGIVIRPSRHVFFSYLSAGPGTDSYQAPYWVSRGRARFYRYVKQ